MTVFQASVQGLLWLILSNVSRNDRIRIATALMALCFFLYIVVLVGIT